MIAAVNDRDIIIWGVAQFHGTGQAAETAADDDDDDMAGGTVYGIKAISVRIRSHG
ncbi:UNVERIFIED_ORG: hypothetical protein GGE13_005838 [Rhizobium etli]